ncbi:hypothetical protein PENSPDRAFT_692792 [Peniophora sp. CONT]|nr:hypothetical protein PENSPDRAFT_692792 [Peniophora sp. CONT]
MSIVGGMRRMSASEQLELQREVARLQRKNDILDQQLEALDAKHEEEITRLVCVERAASAEQLEQARTEAQSAVRREIEDLKAELQREREARQLAEDNNALLQSNQARAQQEIRDLQVARDSLEGQVVELTAQRNAAQNRLAADSAYLKLDLKRFTSGLADLLTKEYEKLQGEEHSLRLSPADICMRIPPLLEDIFTKTMELLYDDHGCEPDVEQIWMALRLEKDLNMIGLTRL